LRLAATGPEEADHLFGEGAGDGLGVAEPATTVAALVGLEVSLVVLVELDFACGGDFDPLFDTLVGFHFGHGCASCDSPWNSPNGRILSSSQGGV
jgi:hypothetical protein